MNAVEQVKFDIEYLQYNDYVNNDMSDNYFIVTHFDGDKNPTRPMFVLRRIKTGEEIKARVRQSNIFKAQPFGQFSVLKIEGFTYAPKRKMINGEWVVSDEYEVILESFEVIRNEQR